MRESLSKKDVKYKVEDGWIHVKVIFQLIGHPQEHVEKTIRAYVDEIATRKDVILIKEEYEKARATEGKLWSAVAEVELLVSDFTTLTFFCINYMPANIEVMGPAKLTISDKNLTDWLGDMLAKLHEVSAMAKAIRAQNDGIVRSINVLAKNYILHLIDEKNDSIAGLERATGMDRKNLEQFLAALVKEGKIKANLDKLAIARDLAEPVTDIPKLPLEQSKDKAEESKKGRKK